MGKPRSGGNIGIFSLPPHPTRSVSSLVGNMCAYRIIEIYAGYTIVSKAEGAEKDVSFAVTRSNIIVLVMDAARTWLEMDERHQWRPADACTLSRANK